MKHRVHTFFIAIVAMLALAMVIQATAFADTLATITTSSTYRYPQSYSETQQKYSKVMAVLNSGKSFPIPGMAQTVTRMWNVGLNGLASDACYDMVPQGICLASDYVLISAYCYPVPETGSKHEHPSVVYVIDRASGDYLCTLSLYEDDAAPFVTELDRPDFRGSNYSRAHVGGLAFDGSNTIWITNKKNSVRTLMLSQVRQAVKYASDAGAASDAVAVTLGPSITCENQASFLTWFDGKLWVGYSNPMGNGSLIGHRVQSDNGITTLSPYCRFVIPQSANGCVFGRVDGHACLAVNASYGRGVDSRMFIYEAETLSGSGSLTPYGHYALPPMAEEMDIANGKLYTIFESSATYYSTQAHREKHIVDRVCVADASDHAGQGRIGFLRHCREQPKQNLRVYRPGGTEGGRV